MLYSTDLLDIDSLLVAELKSDNYEAFEKLYDKYATDVLKRIKKLVLVHEEAEEIFQNIFMKIWEDRARLPIDVPFKAILWRKAKSAAYNFYRKASFDKVLLEKVILSATARYEDLEEYLDFRETNEFLMASIEKLPEQRKKIFKYIKLEGKSYDEAAENFNISLSTVKDHMTRALKFLRQEISQDHPVLLLLLLTDLVFN